MGNESSCRFGTQQVRGNSSFGFVLKKWFFFLGQERFRTITTAYYRGAMGILLVYDVTDEKSFNNIRNWIKNIEQHASESVNKILVGNKCDLLDQKVVDEEAARALAAEYGIKFMEVCLCFRSMFFLLVLVFTVLSFFKGFCQIKYWGG